MTTRETSPVEGAAEGGMVSLRDMRDDDLPAFFEFHLDPAANHMAAFTVEDPSDRAAHDARWARILRDDSIAKRTILLDGEVVGSIVGFERFGRPEVSYWIGREHWGQGLATRGLAAFLREQPARPLHARVAKDNVASLRVLEKCGFSISGEDQGFANARGEEIEEYILELRT